MGCDIFIEQIFIVMMNLNYNFFSLHVYNSICFFPPQQSNGKKRSCKKMDEWKHSNKLKFNKQISKKLVIAIKKWHE
jgi:hypothetical protein